MRGKEARMQGMHRGNHEGTPAKHAAPSAPNEQEGPVLLASSVTTKCHRVRQSFWQRSLHTGMQHVKKDGSGRERGGPLRWTKGDSRARLTSQAWEDHRRADRECP